MPLIVVGVDGSEQSRKALVWALTNAELMRSAVRTVMVVDTSGMDAAQRESRLRDAERTVADLMGAATGVCAHPPEVTSAVVEGDPIAVMLAETYGANLMVFGARRMTSISNPALGTVSLACTRHGACPVLVIPEGVPDVQPCSDLVLA